MKKPIIFGLAFVIAAGLWFPAQSRAQSIQDLQTQLQALIAQIQALQAQIQRTTTGGPTPPVFSPTPAASCITVAANLSRGSRGSEVTALQKTLRQIGAYTGPVTGFFGPLTQSAVRAFQEENGISVNSLVDSATAAAINNLSGCGPSFPVGPPPPTPSTPPTETLPTQETSLLPVLSSEQEPYYDSDNSPDYSSVGISYPITPNKYPDLFTAGVGRGDYLGGGPCLYGMEPNPTTCKQTNKSYTTYYDHCVGANQLNEAFLTKAGKLGAMGVVPPPSGYECRNGAFAAVSGQLSFTVTYPTSGATLTQGQTYNITWIGGDTGVNNYAVYLVNRSIGPDGLYLGTAYPRGAGDGGTFSWAIPPDFKHTGSGFQIQFSGRGATGGDSASFSIVSSIPVQSPSIPVQNPSIPVQNPSITVTSPNGGEQWKVGETRRISWRSTNVSSVRIYIYDSNIYGSGSTQYVVPNNASVSAAPGYYDWDVPSLSYLPGGSGSNNYRIRIDSVDVETHSPVSDSSDAPFSIASSSLGFAPNSVFLASIQAQLNSLALELQRILEKLR